MTALISPVTIYDPVTALWDILDNLEELIELSGDAPHATTDALIAARNTLTTLVGPRAFHTAIGHTTREVTR